MKKSILFILYLYTQISWADLNCQGFTQDRMLALRITKTWNRENELRFGIKVSPNCTFIHDEKVMNVYWYLAKRNGKPCEDPFDNEVEDLIGYKTLDKLYENMSTIIDPETLQVRLLSLPQFAKKTKSAKKISTDIYFTLDNSTGQCLLKSRVLIDGKWVYFNRIHNIIKFLKLKRLELFLDDEKIINI